MTILDTRDTASYMPVGLELTIRLRLENMPSVPTRFGVGDLIANTAAVHFKILGDGLHFMIIELDGHQPLKSGVPSKRSQSDTYTATVNRYIPEPFQEVITYARARLMELLK